MTASERIKGIIEANFVGEGLAHVQIKQSPGTLDFAGKPGWLRYQSNLQYSQSLQPLDEEKFGIPIAGEWMIGEGGEATARLTIENGVQTVCIITERGNEIPADAHWQDVLVETVAVYSRVVKQDEGTPLTQANYDAGQINHRIYYGFRDEADAQTGNIRRLAERMADWKPLSDDEKEAK
jgi:hypothetical protein